MFVSWFWLLSLFAFAHCQQINFTTLIISQPWDYELNYIQKFETNAKEELTDLEVVSRMN